MTLPTAVFKRMFNRQRFLLVISFFLIASIASTVLWADRHQLLTASPEARPFTELYFTAPKELPKEVPAGQPQTLTFSIANHTPKAAEYRYVVRVAGQPVQEQVLRVQSGVRRDIQASYSVAPSVRPVRVAVSLEGTKQTIQTWVRGL